MHRGDPSQSYSWWWNSHFSPKNSKWLQESLSDMDGKVKKMIKIIEEDADSFARRAEMYYKKRPELMKLVEEFYKSYRALAERYDHASGELRQAQKTIAQAFPDQPHFFMNDDGPPLYSNNDAEPQTPETAHPVRSMHDTDDTSGTTLHFPIAKRNGASNEENNNGLNKKGLKQLNDLLGPRDAHVKRGLNFSEDEGQPTGGKGHLSTNDNQKHMVELHEKGTQYDVSDYQDKVQEESEEPKPTLETAIFKLQEKHEAALSEKQQYYEMHQRSLEQITALEKEAIELKGSLSKLQQEKEAALAEKQKHHDVYQSCMQQMAVLKGEASDLKTVLSKLQQEKETIASQYQQYQDMYNSCLQRISGLEAELSHAHEEIKRLTDEVFNGVVKYKTTEERAILLEGENRSLHSQMDTLVQKLVLLQEDLRRESSELERIRICLQEEHLQSMAREAAFQALQQLHSQSQEQQRAIVMEMQHGMHILKDMEHRNTVLEEEVVNLKENYNNMNAQNVSSSIMIKELQGDICSLREAKGRLEAEVELRMDQRNALQQEIYCLNKDKYDLDKKYKGLIEKLESVGLDAECLQLSVKDLQDENIHLKDSCKKKDEEKAMLLQSLKNMENVMEKNNLLEKLLFEKEAELRELGSKSNALEELCSSLKKEISVRDEEKDNLVTKVDNLMQTLLRLETLYDETEKQRLLLEKEIFLLKESCNKKDQEKVVLSQSLKNLEEVHERNKLLEKLFSGKDNELREMVQKANALEEVCNSLKEEIAGLVDEKIRFIGNVHSLKQTLEKLEVTHATTEEQRLHLHKEKELNLTQIKELQTFLDQEKDGHERTIQSSNTKLVNLEDKIKVLQEESAKTRVALEEAEESILDVKIQISIFVSFLEDSQEANTSLVMELQRYNTLSSHAVKRISDLEKRSLEQEMQLGSLQEMTNSIASQNRKLQATILQLLEFHGIEHKNGYLDQTGHDEVLLRVQTQITSMDGLLAKAEDDRQQMAIESIVAGVLLEQFGLQLSSLHSEKNALGLESLSRGDELSVFRKENQELIAMNEVLHQKVISLEKKEKELETEVGISHERLRDAQELSESLRTDNHCLQEENRTFVKDLINLKGQKLVLEEENYIILSEALSLGNLALIFERFNSEKAVEIKRLSTVLDHISGINYALIEEARITLDKVKSLEMENSNFKSSAVTVEDYESCSASLKNEVDTFRNACGKLNHQIEHGMKLLKEKELKLSEAEEKLEKMQNEKEELLKESERVVTCLSEIMGKKEALEKELMELEDDNTNKSGEVDRLNRENQMLKLELDNLHKQITEFHVREAHLKSELQKNLKGIEVLHSSAGSLFSDFQGSVIHVILLEQKVQELITACKHLEEHSNHQAREYSNRDTLKDAEVSQLKKENRALDQQNKTLKLQSCIYLSLIKSLKESIHELEDHRFAFARTSDVSNTSQGVGVCSLDIDPVIGEDEVSDNYVDDGPGELENLKPNIEEVNRMVKNLRNVKNGYDEIRASKEVLEEQLNLLNEQIFLKSKEIRSIYDEKERFEVKVDELLREIDEFQLRETYLNSELKEKASEIGLCQTDLETLYQDLQISVIHEIFMKEKMKDFLGACMMLEEKALTEGKKFVADIASRCVQIDELNRNVAALEAEKQVNSAEYSNHKFQLAQLKGSLSSIEDHCQKALGKKMDGPICREIRDIDFRNTSDKDIDALELQQLQTKLNSVEEMVVKLVQLRRQSCTKDEDIGTSEFTTEQGQPKSIRLSMDSAHHQNDPVTKDIQLDHVSDFPSSYESSAGSFAVNELEITNTEDQMLELWETAEQHSARKLEPLAPKKMKLDSTDDALMPLPPKFKNNAKVPAESQTEREVSIDKIVVPLEMSKKDREAVANEVCRLLDMQNNVQGLKKRFGRLKKNNHSSELDINITKDKLENAEVAIVHLLERNHKILEDGHGERVKASSSEIKELGGHGKSILNMGSMNKVHGDKEEGSENIDHLVLELQKIELLLCKLEERQVRRNQQAIQKRSRVILSDYLYGVNQGRRSKLCACLMPATKGD